jgi:putative endopeptidase
MRGHATYLGATIVALAAYSAGLAAQQSPAPHIIDRARFDSSCGPCQDFYRFVNGGWLDTVKIPASYPRTGVGREQFDRNELILRQIMETAAADRSAPGGSVTRKLGDFYATCMDSVQAERLGVAPLNEEFALIAAVRDRSSLLAELARLSPMGVVTPIGTGAFSDFKNSNINLLAIAQSGLGMPDRDYYTKSDSASVHLRADYVAHVARTLRLLGDSSASAQAEASRIMALETSMASSQMTLVEQRDIPNIYHRVTLDSLRRLAPAIDWNSYFADVRVPHPAAVNVMQPKYFSALSTIIVQTPISTWKEYMRWQLASAATPTLNSAFVNNGFAWASRLNGVTEQLPRWKRCLGATDIALGEALGQVFVEKSFTPQAKRRMLDLVHNLQAALTERLAGLTWMSDETRRQALAKLNAFTVKVGYPDTWRDYSLLAIDRSSYWGNSSRASMFEDARNMAKVDKPVDRAEWQMTPQTVDAYSNPLFNEIVFPAGILQPPLFDVSADDAVNYGSIGAIIGHEITHGFDDQGRQFDAQGNLRDWWTAQDAQNFTSRGERVVNQYSTYLVGDTLHINGKLTEGENIADIGGLKIAYAALQKALKGKPRTLIDGYTPEQRFFLAYASTWRNKTRPEAARLQALTDPHSPPEWRVTGVLVNMPEFAQAFGCKAGDPMVAPGNRMADIW